MEKVEITDEEEEEDLMFELDAGQTVSEQQLNQKEMSDKLDSLLLQMFSFLEQTHFVILLFLSLILLFIYILLI